MKVIADLCVIPIGVGTSVSSQVALCERILAEAGLKTKLHAYGTNIEGERDAVFAAVKRCHELRRSGSTRAHGSVGGRAAGAGPLTLSARLSRRLRATRGMLLPDTPAKRFRLRKFLEWSESCSLQRAVQASSCVPN